MSEPYRDELAPLRQRLDVVNTDLAEVKRRLQGQQALHEEQASLENEARELNDRIRRRASRSLPMLDRVKIASPCDARWDDMTGDAHRRHCSECDKNVYDLSSLTRNEAEALLQKHEGELCVRFYRRADGTVLTADCPVGVSRRRRRWVAFSALALGTLGGVSLFISTSVVMGRQQDHSPPMPMTGASMVEPAVSGSASIPPEPCPSIQGEMSLEMGQKVAPQPVQGRMPSHRPAGSAAPKTTPKK